MDYHILDGLQILVLVPSECIWSFQCLFPRFRNLLLNRKTKKKGRNWEMLEKRPKVVTIQS